MYNEGNGSYGVLNWGNMSVGGTVRGRAICMAEYSLYRGKSPFPSKITFYHSGERCQMGQEVCSSSANHAMPQ